MLQVIHVHVKEIVQRCRIFDIHHFLHLILLQTTSMPKVVGRPPPIIITVLLNLMKFQGGLKPIVKGMFEFRATRNGIKVVTKVMANYSTLRHHLDTSKIPYYTFHPKSLKPVNATCQGIYPQRIFQMNYWHWASVSSV